MEKLPDRQFPMPIDAMDWLLSEPTTLMAPEARGALVTLYAISWVREECSITASEAALAILTGLNERWGEYREQLLAFFPPHPTLPGRLANPKLLARRAELVRESELLSRRMSALARKRHGKRGATK